MTLPPILLISFLLTHHSPASNENFETLVKQGNYHAARFEEENALKNYLAAEKIAPKNAHLLTAISKVYRHLMSEAEEKKAKLSLGNIALQYAERAAASDTQNSHAQLSTAITLGKLVPYLNSKEKLAASKRIKNSADRALALDPKNDTAWFVLGSWHHGFADMSPAKKKIGSLFHGKMPESTFSDAIACFLRAIQIAPQRPMHHIQLGHAYHGMNKITEAKQALTHGLSLPNTEKDDPTTKARARKTLRSLKYK